MNGTDLEKIVLERPDICDRWRQHRSASAKPLSLGEFAERVFEKERLANREMPEGAAYYSYKQMEGFEV